MKLGIMQPYLFPYLGYFQIIAAVDRFVIYDDVGFIKQGWINRNRILLRGEPHLFSVPLEGASSNRTIRDVPVSVREFPRWREKFLKTFDLAYTRAPRFQAVRELLVSVLEGDPGSAADLARRSILAVCQSLGLTTTIVPTSTVYENGHLRAQDRVLDICAREGASLYINAQGGRELYDHPSFSSRSLELRFIRSHLPAYPQFDHPFVPGLSILDILAFNEPAAASRMLSEFTLEM